MRKLDIQILDFITNILVAASFVVMAFALNGDWLVVLVYCYKHVSSCEDKEETKFENVQEMLASYKLTDFPYFWILGMLVGYGIYFGIGGFFHWYYYRRQKNNANEWKCQPMRWLPPDLELDEVRFGSISLMVTNTLSSFLACYIYNDGYSTVYYDFNEFGYLWFLLQWPVIFIYQDYLTYWMHRLFHTPYLYNRFHKAHHKYVQPTAFAVTAIHPVEISFMQIVLVIPLFTIPVHWMSVSSIAVYSYYHGILTHSGINFKAKWWQPWQTDSVYHDNHHQYFHVNFGFNFSIWDKMHGTYRDPKMVYNEKIFYGHGKPLTELSHEDLIKEFEERNTETNAIYKDHKNPYVVHEYALKLNKDKHAK